MQLRLEQLQRERMGGLKHTEDLSNYGSNSPRRTWNTMAAKLPESISKAARNRQARWRQGQRKKDWGGDDGMAELYNEPDLEELLRPTYYLSATAWDVQMRSWGSHHSPFESYDEGCIGERVGEMGFMCLR